MGVGYLRLQCVRGTVPAVCRTVESLVAANGWRRVSAESKRSTSNSLRTFRARPLARPALHFSRDVRIREESGWVVVDAGEGHAEPWAARIASALGTTGIKLTSYSDEDELELDRYDAGRHTMHIAHQSPHRPVRLSLAFLSDLVPSARRALLRRWCARAAARIGRDHPRNRPARRTAKAARGGRVG